MVELHDPVIVGCLGVLIGLTLGYLLCRWQFRKPAPPSFVPGWFEPIHHWFELSYANYLAIPRSILQNMPAEWQRRFVDCLEDLDTAFDWRRAGCVVKFHDKKGRFMRDELVDYDRGRRVLTPEEVAAITTKHNQIYFEGNWKTEGDKP